MNRIDRLNAIMVHLQGKSRVPLTELEARFEMGRRTVFRDIRSLIDAGVPIGGDAGEGYFIVEGYHLPPVVFNKEEAAALLLASKLINQNADSHTSNLVEAAMSKVRAVLRMSDRDFVEALDSKIEIIGSPSVMKQGFPDSNISDLQVALATKKVIRMAYYSNYNDSTTEREVEPLGLVYYANRWHLIGYCRLRKELRDFRTDRIQTLTVTPEAYRIEDHPDFLSFISGMVGGTDAKEAVVRFSKKIARFIGDQKYYYGFIEEHEVAEGIEMKFITPNYDYFGRWLLSYADEVTVVAPSELQGIVATHSRTLFEHHKKYFSVEN
jgi:predicted DNA-binding transcriptional regulator YafY